jgi:short subunit dehydrogenase-like uncharacterized protein
VVEACVGNGAHYLDLSGEMPFLRRTIDSFHEAASAAGVKVIQPCGFEALPPDLVVLMASEAARERWGGPLDEVDVEASFDPPPGVPRPSDLLSGGTLQSLTAIVADPDASRMVDPACLIGDRERAEAVRRRSPIAIAPRRGRGGQVIAPMAPSGFINPAVIHRTATLVPDPDGKVPPPFRYREGVVVGGPPAALPLRFSAAGALSATQAGLAKLVGAGPATRRRIGGALERLLPSSGYGPSGDRMEGWRWRVSASGRATGGGAVRATLDAEGHPGYLATARMMGEAGLLLADPALTPDRAGCLTPAAALGTGSLARFEGAHLRFALDAESA